eukprot:1972469-Rhodomonas_salina.1
MSGTELAYGATRHGVHLGGALHRKPRYSPTRLLRDVRVSCHLPYAKCGTELAYGATRSQQEASTPTSTTSAPS